MPWLAGIIVIFAIYLYASPYIVLNNIKKAAEQGDADKLSVYIDFPSVKQSMKDQVKAFMLEEIASSEEQDGFEALGTMLAAAMVDPIIDGVVTPDGVALMLQGQKLDFDLNQKSKNKPAPKGDDIDYKTSYLSFNRFKVQINDADDAENSIDVIMHRDWLSWQVTRINFSLGTKQKSSNNRVEDTVLPDLSWADEEDDVVIVEDDEFADEFEDVFHGIADGGNEVDDFANEIADSGNSKPSIWRYGFGMGYSEYSIQDAEGRTLWVVCNEGAGADYDHGAYLDINDDAYANTDSAYPLTFIIDDRIEVAPPGTTTWRNGAIAWDEFTDNISTARKIEVYLNNEKVTTFNPTVASINETSKSIADCQSMLFNDTEW